MTWKGMGMKKKEVRMMTNKELDEVLTPLAERVILSPTKEFTLTALRLAYRLGEVDAAKAMVEMQEAHLQRP